MRRAVLGLLLSLVACSACNFEPSPVVRKVLPQPRPALALDVAARVHGDLPAGPEVDVLRTRCQICHTLEYVTQQRLTDAQWDKTLGKMQKWGSPITEDERKLLVPYLAMTWPKELPERESPHVVTPAGATP